MQLADVETVCYYTAVDISYYHNTAANLKNFKDIVHSVHHTCFKILYHFDIQTAAAEYFFKLLQAAVLKVINLIVQFTAETVKTDTVVDSIS